MQRGIARVVLTCALLCGVSARANYTFPTFSLEVGSDPFSVPLDTSEVAPGDYSGCRVLLDWAPAMGLPWSSEAEWQLEQPGLPVPLADSGRAINAADNTNPLLLRWRTDFVQTYIGGDPLVFTGQQLLPHSSAAWNNVTVILLSGEVPPAVPPAATELGFLQSGAQAQHAALGPHDVRWYRFETAAISAAQGGYLSLTTLGSLLAGGEFGNGNDTEAALYNAAGLRMTTNDDIDQAGGNLLSGLLFGADPDPHDGIGSAGDLAAGAYYLAVTGFDATFGPSGFNALSTSPVAGALTVNIATNVPEPLSMILSLTCTAAIALKRPRSGQQWR